MKSYPYSRLPDSSIRLLHLLPSPDKTSPIKCRLSTYPLLKTDRPHRYEALSYVWGTEADQKSINVDNHKIDIGINLHDALIRLRDDFFERVLWADALCINQHDNSEKGIQVQAIALIYAKASQVVV